MIGFQVRRITLRWWPTQTRFPFQYGIASLTRVPHVFVFLDATVAGRSVRGVSSEGLPPKWFTKDPATTFEEDLVDLLDVIEHAGSAAVQVGPANHVFQWWQQLYSTQRTFGQGRQMPALLWGLGSALIERAAIDAVCRACQKPFATALRDGTLGFDPSAIYPKISCSDPSYGLPDQPTQRIAVRHTVGLGDPLTDDDVPAGEALDDGLPYTLADNIKHYSLSHFKLKLSGDDAHDWERLARIGNLFNQHAPGSRFTLDGNEQYHDLSDFQRFWARLQSDPPFEDFHRHLLAVEQPLHRQVALTPDTAAAMRQWTHRPAMIIDESDGDADALPAALDAGYVGTSYKNCKGVFRGLANAALLAYHRPQHPQTPCIMTGEDLANLGPAALLQDLAVVATLGLTHVERNGHHYFRGLSVMPQSLEQLALAQHADLYRPLRDGTASLRIERGELDLHSVTAAPFGLACVPDPQDLQPLDRPLMPLA